MRSIALLLAVGVFGALAFANAPQGQAATSDAAYITQAMSAAPAAVGAGASVVRMDKNGAMTTVRPGTNGFTCMVMEAGVAMCADANAMAFFGAYMKHAAPPDKTGIAYMLAGDAPGTSNTDPYATSKTATNHWVITGPHIMVVGAGAKTMGLPATNDPDTTKPYMMWPGTQYEHAMIPVAASK